MASNHICFTSNIMLNRTDQLYAVTSGPQNSEALTTAHLSQLISVVVSCPPDANSVFHAQPESASQSHDPLAVSIVHNAHNLNTTNNHMPLEASSLEAKNVAEIPYSAHHPMPFTCADLANSIGGSA